MPGSYYGGLYGFLYGSGAPAPISGAAPIYTDAPPFEGDALLLHTLDGGDVRITQGDPTRSGGLHNAVYLSLFGGNDTDTGLADDRQQWWGDTLDTDPMYQYRGRTAYLLRTLPSTGPTLVAVESAAADDLAWMVELGLADSVEVVSRVVAPKQLELAVTTTVDGRAEKFLFLANWGSRS